MSARENNLASKTLVCLLQGLADLKSNVKLEMRDETIVTGKMKAVDGYMNIEMTDVTYESPTGVIKQFEKYFCQGKFIRYAGIPDDVDPIVIIEDRLSVLAQIPVRGRGRGGRGRGGRGRGGRGGRFSRGGGGGGSSRYGSGNGSSSRYGGGDGGSSSRYGGGDGGSSKYGGGDSGSSRYASDGGSSRYGGGDEGRSSKYSGGEGSSSKYSGGGSSSSKYDGDRRSGNGYSSGGRY